MYAHDSNAIPKMIPTVVFTARSLAGLQRWQVNVELLASHSRINR